MTSSKLIKTALKAVLKQKLGSVVALQHRSGAKAKVKQWFFDNPAYKN